MCNALPPTSYEKLKTLFADKDGKLSVPARLAAGAGAACVSTVVTYPLDIIRFRMAVDPTLNTIPQVVRAVVRDEGLGAFYKGLVPSCIGIAPYSSINFAAFDLCVGGRHVPACSACSALTRPRMHSL